MTVATLRGFGGVIKQLAARCDDPEIRFWAFISYLSTHPTQLLSATPPPELSDRVSNLLAEARLPIVAADIKPPPKETGRPQRTMAIPDSLLQAYLSTNEFHGLESIQVRRSNGSIVNGILMSIDGTPQFMLRADIEMLPEEIVAIRKAPGCLFGWLVRPKWIDAV